jgi:hypothetical protein
MRPLGKDGDILFHSVTFLPPRPPFPLSLFSFLPCFLKQKRDRGHSVQVANSDLIDIPAW